MNDRFTVDVNEQCYSTCWHF